MNHNKVIDDLYSEIQQKSGVADSKELSELQSKLEQEKMILRETVQKAMMEQRRNKSEKWDPLPVNIKENFWSYIGWKFAIFVVQYCFDCVGNFSIMQE